MSVANLNHFKSLPTGPEYGRHADDWERVVRANSPVLRKAAEGIYYAVLDNYAKTSEPTPLRALAQRYGRTVEKLTRLSFTDFIDCLTASQTCPLVMGNKPGGGAILVLPGIVDTMAFARWGRSEMHWADSGRIFAGKAEHAVRPQLQETSRRMAYLPFEPALPDLRTRDEKLLSGVNPTEILEEEAKLSKQNAVVTESSTDEYKP